MVGCSRHLGERSQNRSAASSTKYPALAAAAGNAGDDGRRIARMTEDSCRSTVGTTSSSGRTASKRLLTSGLRVPPHRLRRAPRGVREQRELVLEQNEIRLVVDERATKQQLRSPSRYAPGDRCKGKLHCVSRRAEKAYRKRAPAALTVSLSLSFRKTSSGG